MSALPVTDLDQYRSGRGRRPLPHLYRPRNGGPALAMVGLAVDLDAMLAGATTLWDLQDIAQGLGVSLGVASKVIRYHRRHVSDHAEALCMTRGQGWAGYWLSSDPDEIASYGSQWARALLSQLETLDGIVDRGVAQSSRGKQKKAAKDRQTALAAARRAVDQLG